MIYARQEVQVRQGQILAPRLQQSVKFLQMSTLEFRQAVEQALATNPFLEETEDDAEGSETADQASIEASSEAPPDDGAYPGEYPRAAPADTTLDPLEREAAATGLTERLLQALSTIPLSDRDRALAVYLIDSLDADGYLRQALESLYEPADFSPPPEAIEWRTALALVQHLDAPGIGARDVRECLLLQLQAQGQTLEASGTSKQAHLLALAITEDHLPRLARNDWPGLCRELGVGPDELAQACQIIRDLDPHPGRRYDAGTAPYVIPDVMVDRYAGSWRVRSNPACLPRVRLHHVYADWFRGARRDERSPLAQEIQEARWLVRNIEQRHATIRRVAEAIIQRQRRFFEYGDVALRPLMLREVADDLELHESTVSRATIQKYMMTPRGLFEFRHFFSRKLDTEAGGACSANAVRALIRELVASENARDPLSDVDLTRELARHGILLARRTVTKYRTQQKIASVELRRSHGDPATLQAAPG
ncbi:MAG: RNA polymerase factor sigma-54 [Pigmentiphaga sp.]